MRTENDLPLDPTTGTRRLVRTTVAKKAPKRRRLTKKPIPMPERGPMSRRRPAPPPPDPNMQITLTVRHSINGLTYGPGTIVVPKSIADTLIENEQRSIAEERKAIGSKPRAAMILPGGRSVQVPPETFDDPNYAAGMPASITMNGGQR